MRVQSLQNVWVDITNRVFAINAVQVTILWYLNPIVLLIRVCFLDQIVSC